MTAPTNADITPYRRFPGTAREAMETYQRIFGGELQIMPYSAIHTDDEAGDQGDKVMHAELIINGRKVLFAADAPGGDAPQKGEGTPLSITGGPAQAEQIREHWERLAEGGTIDMPLERAPWEATYGQLTDRFGTIWMFNIAPN
jgi:PhnB protein